MGARHREDDAFCEHAAAGERLGDAERATAALGELVAGPERDFQPVFDAALGALGNRS